MARPSFIVESLNSWRHLLSDAAIESKQLLDQGRIKPNTLSGCHAVSYFPLEWFDDKSDDVTPPAHSSIEKALAIALLPNRGGDSTCVAANLETIHDWCMVTVLSYDPKNQLWTVMKYKTEEEFKVHDIFLHRLSDNAKARVARLKSALAMRQQLDMSFKMATLLDCMNLKGLQMPSSDVTKRIWHLAAANPKVPLQQRTQLQEHFTMDYMRVSGMLEIQRYYKKGRLFGTNAFIAPLPLQLGQANGRRRRRRRRSIVAAAELPALRHAYQFNGRLFRLSTVFNRVEIVKAMQEFLLEDEALAKLSLFTVGRCGRETLSDFERAQKTTATLAVNYLRGIWAPNLRAIVRMWLTQCGNGDFDVAIDDWAIYSRSRAQRFLGHIRCRMECSIRQLVLRSVDAYCEYLCMPCAVCLQLLGDFAWGSNFRHSPFNATGAGDNYIFQVTLDMNEDGAYFLTRPDDFGAFAIDLMDAAVTQTHTVDVIDAHVMSRLTYAADLRLSSIGLAADAMIESRNRLRQSFEAAVIPLKAYAKAFDEFIEAQRLNVDDYMAAIGGAAKSSLELKEVISESIRWRDRLQTELPHNIIIGPFKVLVGDLKSRLIGKYQDLLQRLLQHLSTKLTRETQVTVDRYTEAYDRLRRRPHTIEDIANTVAWMDALPRHLASLEHVVKMKLYEYEILDGFLHALDDAEAEVKWTAVIYPYRIRRQVEPTLAVFETGREQFAKQQNSDLLSFDEQQETLNGSVFTMASQADVQRAAEYAIDAARLWTSIRDAHRQGEVLNRRQALFNRPTIDLSALSRLAETFAPFRTLWSAAGGFLKLRDTSMCNPLNIVDVGAIRQGIDQLRGQLVCGNDFVELPNVEAARTHFLAELLAFEGLVGVLGDVKNPDWLVIHWQELCKLAAIEIKSSATLTFGLCMDRGILQHRDLVRDISRRATEHRHELEMERRLEEEAKRAEEAARMAFKQKRRGRKLD